MKEYSTLTKVNEFLEKVQKELGVSIDSAVELVPNSVRKVKVSMTVNGQTHARPFSIHDGLNHREQEEIRTWCEQQVRISRTPTLRG
jgi:hypothetical protein